jgi:hypothetical protein
MGFEGGGFYNRGVARGCEWRWNDEAASVGVFGVVSGVDGGLPDAKGQRDAGRVDGCGQDGGGTECARVYGRSGAGRDARWADSVGQGVFERAGVFYGGEWGGGVCERRGGGAGSAGGGADDPEDRIAVGEGFAGRSTDGGPGGGRNELAGSAERSAREDETGQRLLYGRGAAEEREVGVAGCALVVCAGGGQGALSRRERAGHAVAGSIVRGKRRWTT